MNNPGKTQHLEGNAKGFTSVVNHKKKKRQERVEKKRDQAKSEARAARIGGGGRISAARFEDWSESDDDAKSSAPKKGVEDIFKDRVSAPKPGQPPVKKVQKRKKPQQVKQDKIEVKDVEHLLELLMALIRQTPPQIGVFQSQLSKDIAQKIGAASWNKALKPRFGSLSTFLKGSACQGHLTVDGDRVFVSKDVQVSKSVMTKKQAKRQRKKASKSNGNQSDSSSSGANANGQKSSCCSGLTSALFVLAVLGGLLAAFFSQYPQQRRLAVAQLEVARDHLEVFSEQAVQWLHAAKLQIEAKIQ